MTKFSLYEVCFSIVSQFFRFAEKHDEISASDLERYFTEEFSHAFTIDEDTSRHIFKIPFWVLCNPQDTGIYTQKMHYFSQGSDAKWEQRLLPKKEMLTPENKTKYCQELLNKYGENIRARLDSIL